MGAERIYRRFRDLLDVTFGTPADGDVIQYDLGTDELVLGPLAAAGGSPTGPAGGDLSGTYPNPEIAANAVGAAEIAANAVTSSELADNAVDTAAIQNNAVTAAKVAADVATQAEVDAVAAAAVNDGDAAGGVLSGIYPNPGFAADMATQAELDALAGTVATDAELAAMLDQAVILAPASSARNVIQPTAGAVIAAIVKAHAAQSVDLTQWQKSDGTVLGSVGPTGAILFSPSDDTLSSLVTLQAPVGFNANSPDGFLWQAFTEDGTQTFVMDTYGGWQLVAPTGEGAAVVALQAESADGAYSLNLASGRASGALDYFINGTIPDLIVPATPRSVFYLYKTGDGYFNPTLATVPNWGVLAGGHESLGALAAIADGDVRTDERVQWYDSAIGAPLLRFKMRDSAGTLFTGISASQAYVDGLFDDHSARHENGGADEISLAGLSGEPADVVAKSLYDANTVLAADADNTPAALTMGASTILARLAAGNIVAATPAEINTLLGWTTVVKGSDESVSGSTTVQQDDALFFTAVSGAFYEVEICLIYGSPAGAGTPDLKVATGEDNTNRGGSLVFNILNASDVGASTPLVAVRNNPIAIGTAAANRMLLAKGHYCGGGGTFAVMWAQQTSDANATIVRAGSVLRYRRIL